MANLLEQLVNLLMMQPAPCSHTRGEPTGAVLTAVLTAGKYDLVPRVHLVRYHVIHVIRVISASRLKQGAAQEHHYRVSSPRVSGVSSDSASKILLVRPRFARVLARNLSLVGSDPTG